MTTSVQLRSRPRSGPGAPPAAGPVCCSPLVREPITPDQAVDLARGLKALADPTRLRLVSMIAAHDGGEACVCELTEPLDLSQPTVSHHLKVLVDAGVLVRDKRGVWAYYAIIPATLEAISTALATTNPARPAGSTGPAARAARADRGAR